jgi:hypothetical protein
VRQFSSADKPAKLDAERYFADDWVKPPASLSAKAGTHRFVWDLRYPRPRAIEYGYSIAATWDSDTPVTPEGPMVLPGNYQVVLHVDGKSYQAPLVVALDPREQVSKDELVAALAYSRNIAAVLQRVWQGYGEVEAVRDQLDALDRKLGQNAAHKPLLESVNALRTKTTPLVDGTGETSLNLHAISDALAAIATDVEGADHAPTAGQQQALAQYQTSVDQALAQWNAIRATDLAKLNKQLRDAGIAAINESNPARAQSAEPEESEDTP